MHCLNLVAAAGLFAAHAVQAAPRGSAFEPSHARRHDYTGDDVVPRAKDWTRNAHAQALAACPAPVLIVTTITVDVTVCVAPEPTAMVPCPENKAETAPPPSPEPCGCDDDDDDGGETRGKNVKVGVATPSRVVGVSECAATTIVPEETEHVPLCDEGSTFSRFAPVTDAASLPVATPTMTTTTTTAPVAA